MDPFAGGPAPDRPRLFVDVQHGLCNRLRALVSGAAIAARTGRQLVVIWVPDHHCEARIGDVLRYPGMVIEERDTAYQYVFCDAPSDDPNTTCFLLPDSWQKDIGEQQGEWVCMHNHVGVTLGLSAEDSY